MRKNILLITLLLLLSGCNNENFIIENNETKNDLNLTLESNSYYSEDTNIDSNISEEITNINDNNIVENNGIDDRNITIKLNNKNILIIDNDVYDPDYIPLVLGAMHENRWGFANIKLMIISDIGISGKTNMLYRSILETFDSNISLAITKKHEGVVFHSKLTNGLEEHIDIVTDSQTDDAIFALQNTLESQEDKTVNYATGGKLKFLKDFISDPYRYELFLQKVKDITFGLGCNPNDMQCERDHNLASTDAAYDATKIVYSKLQGKIPFNVVVFDERRSDRSYFRGLDLFKEVDIPVMTHLLSANIYGTYGDHHIGDIEVLLANSRKEHFDIYNCKVELIKKSFKAIDIGKGGIDRIFINRDIDADGITRAMYKSLITHKLNNTK